MRSIITLPDRDAVLPVNLNAALGEQVELIFAHVKGELIPINLGLIPINLGLIPINLEY